MGSTGRHAAPADPAAAARDDVTLGVLLTAVHAGADDVVAFRQRWWDGDAYSPCAVVRLDGRRRRVVETCGRALVLPGRSWKARRALHRERSEAATTHTRAHGPQGRPGTPGLPSSAVQPIVLPSPLPTGAARGLLLLERPPVSALPQQRATPRADVRLGGDGDYRSCRYGDCGGLLVLPAVPGEPAPEVCPACGRR